MCSIVENKVLHTWWKRKHLLTIILYPIAWPIVENKVLLVQGKETISLRTMIRNEDISINTPQSFANDSDIYLVEQVNKHCHRNGKLKFLIKWLGYSNRQNTWEPEDHFSPALVHHRLIKSLWLKFWQKEHQSLRDVIYHVLLYCYASLCCSPHL